MPLWKIAALVFVAFAAGTIDAIAGGGGLLTVPALLASGLPPQLALGTNKGQSVFGSFAANARFARGRLVEWRRVLIGFPLGFVGSWLGARAMLAIPTDVLRVVIVALLIAAGLFIELRPAPKPGRASASRAWIAPIALAMGAYDGFFGPGTGTFLIVAFVAVLGDSLLSASAHAKGVNFASNLAAVMLFAWRGWVVWEIALPMAAGQLLGGVLGAHWAIGSGDRVVRRALFAVVIALCIKLALDLR